MLLNRFRQWRRKSAGQGSGPPGPPSSHTELRRGYAPRLLGLYGSSGNLLRGARGGTPCCDAPLRPRCLPPAGRRAPRALQKTWCRISSRRTTRDLDGFAGTFAADIIVTSGGNVIVEGKPAL